MTASFHKKVSDHSTPLSTPVVVQVQFLGELRGFSSAFSAVKGSWFTRKNNSLGPQRKSCGVRREIQIEPLADHLLVCH
jgi:hypothetical protein